MRHAAAALLLGSIVVTGCNKTEEPTALETGTPAKTVAAAPDKPLDPGSPAPQFSLPATDGKSYTLASLTEQGPAFVYFLKAQCSGNPVAVPIVTKLANAYKGKLNVIGVINSGNELARQEISQYGIPFPLLLDEKKDLIHSYGLPHSQHVYLLGKDGKIEQAFHGYGKAAMDSLNAAMAKTASMPVAKVDLSTAPAGEVFG